MPLTLTQERAGEVHRDQRVRRLRRADVVDDGGAWFVTIALRRVASRFGLLRYVWHPALFVFAITPGGFFELAKYKLLIGCAVHT